MKKSTWFLMAFCSVTLNHCVAFSTIQSHQVLDGLQNLDYVEHTDIAYIEGHTSVLKGEENV